MNDLTEIEIVLWRIGEVLSRGGNDNWASAFKIFHKELNENSSRTISNIKSIYGGMGSFNDIIIYRNGSVDFKANEELDNLRAELYRLCHG